MTTHIIPTLSGVPNYTQRTKLDGVEYNLRFLWNQRTGRWHVDINDSAGTPLVGGIKLVTNWPLLRYYQWDTRVPPGNLCVIAQAQDQSPPGFNDLGVGLRCELTYFPKTDL